VSPFLLWWLKVGGIVAGVSLVPVLVGHRIGGRGWRAQALATLAFVLLGAALGAVSYDDRAHGVPPSQALEGAALVAGLIVALPAAVYLQLGYRARQLMLSVGVWLASLIPLLVYLLAVALAVQQKVYCSPGEDCNPFS